MPGLFDGRARTLRWLIVGSFTQTPSARPVRVSGERFSDLMRRLDPNVRLELPDPFGSAPTRTVDLEFVRPRDFRIADVVSRVPMLTRLLDIATNLTRNDAPLSLRQARAAVVELVGEGPLTRALDTHSSKANPSEPDSGGRSTQEQSSAQSDSADAILAKADAPTTHQQARSGVDAFVRAMRTPSSSSSKTAPVEDRQRSAEAAQAIRCHVDAFVRELLATPELAAIERAWRDLRMIVAEAPGHDELALDLLDAGPDDLVSALERSMGRDLLERPDAVFVLHALDEARLAELADLARREDFVVIADAPEGLLEHLLDGDGSLPESWSELRGRESAPWLAAAANPVVTASEDGVAQGGPRVVSGHASAGVAALLTASLQRTSALSNAIGRSGAISSPASREVQLTPDQTVTIPTWRLVSLEGLRAAAAAGLLCLGADAHRHQVLLVDAPMIGGDRGLAASILTGRARRFIGYVFAHLPHDATPTETAVSLGEAAAAFLPNIPASAVSFEVGDSNRRNTRVSLGSELLGAPVSFFVDLT